VYLLLGGAISWKSVKQSVIALSTREAEFVACFEAIIQANWLWNFILRLGVVDSIAKPLKIIVIILQQYSFLRTTSIKGAKHMELKYLVVKEEVQKRRVLI